MSINSTAISDQASVREIDAASVLDAPNKGGSKTVLNRQHGLLRELIATTKTRSSPSSRVVLIGDTVLSHLTPELLSMLEPVDLTIQGDRISLLSHRLTSGLSDLLAQLFSPSTSTSNVIVLQISTRDLLSKTSSPASKVLPLTACDTLQQLLDILLATHASTHVLVTGFFPRRDMPPGIIRRASTELRGLVETRNLAAEDHSRLRFVDAPLSITSGHLETRVQLNPVGCRLFADVLNPVLNSIVSGDDMQTAAMSKDATIAPERGERTTSKGPLRPAQDVLSRIVHDTDNYDANGVIIGYEDRHEEIQEVKASEWQKESTDEYWVPMHRVRYFRLEDGEILWHRERRVDGIFQGRRDLDT